MGNNRFIAMAVLAMMLLGLISALLTYYTDWLFFVETGYAKVFITALRTQAAAMVLSGSLVFLFVVANLKAANRVNFPPRSTVFEDGTIHQLQRNDLAQLVAPFSMFAGVLLTLLAARWGAVQWQHLLLFTNSIPVGTTDPILGKDLGFYLFRMPLLEQVKEFSGMIVLLTTILVMVGYYLRGGLILTERKVQLDLSVRRHLAILLWCFSLVLAAGLYLDGIKLLYYGNSALSGAGFSDVNSRIPTYRILAMLTPLAGAACAWGVWRGTWRIALAPPLMLGLLFGLGVKVYPALLQKFKVAPNEMALELPYIEHNIRFTRLGYDLEKVETVPFDVNSRLTAAGIAANDATIKNIRLWDHAPLLKTYSQLQQIRTYYKFFDVDNDRYLVNGQYTQVMLSPRELSYADLPSKNWINERLIFTHGNGITFGPVSRISKEGLPEFFVKDIPTVSLADIKVTRPEIYYGELSNDYVVVKTKVPEFSYPTATGNINTTYAGRGGVQLDSLLKKVLFAAHFKTEKLLFSSDITNESRILYYRTIGQRVRTVAPFLSFDNDPYMVVTKDGNLKWIIDAYTHSQRLPYARPTKSGINYMRNSVKAVVDAYDGSIDLYISDPDDVLIKVYAKIFPTMFKPMSAMSPDLRQHIRYPHQFMQVQASMFATYHMTDPKVFYNKENLWDVPVLGEQQMEPYYTIMKLPGEKKEEYILMLPFTPFKRDNLAAWMTARCDGDNYGKLIAYTFPRDRLIYGPKQIDARINQDSAISQQLTLWSQRGSQVIRGSMLVIPIEKSLLYVQPLFLAAADKAGLPELRRVIVAFGDEVVMEETLELALQRIFGGRQLPVAAAKNTLNVPPQQGASISELARRAMASYEKALNLQRQGDWTGYGEELRKLQQLLKQMAQ